MSNHSDPPKNSFSIRKATLADLEVIAQFNAAIACETENLSLDPKRVRDGVEALLRDPAKGTYYVAEVDGHVVGQLLITLEWSDWRNGMFWWVQSVYVQKEFRSRGVFSALFKHVSELARAERNVCGVRLYVDSHNHHAKKIYEKHLFHRTNYELFEIVF